MQPRDYQVGYGRPPKSTRFKKGESGNRRGSRPPRNETFKDVIEQVMRERISYTLNGEKRKGSREELLYQQVIYSAAMGKRSARRMLPRLLTFLAKRRGGSSFVFELMPDNELANVADPNPIKAKRDIS